CAEADAIRSTTIDAHVAMSAAAVMARAANLAEVCRDAVADRPALNSGSEFGDDTGGFVTRYSRPIDEVRTGTAIDVQIAAANPGRFHLDQHFVCCWARSVSFLTDCLSLAGVAYCAHSPPGYSS